MPTVARVVVALTAVILAGCSGPDAPPGPSSNGPEATSSPSADPTPSSSTTSRSSTSTTSTPVTQLGILTGPGVDDTQIRLGMLIDKTADRGFLTGVQLWRTSINDDGGVCGRTVTLVGSDADGTLLDDYRQLGTEVLGFVVDATDPVVVEQLGTGLSADEIPAIATGGSTADLLRESPTVVGATDDILAINALDDAITERIVRAGDTVGVVADGSPSSASALSGLRWYASRVGVELQVQTATGRDIAALAGSKLVFALGDSELTAAMAQTLPTATVVTLLAGYDPTLLDSTEASRTRIAMTTPAPGSTQPGTAAVEAALAATGQQAGPSTFAGYAAGASWGRLLTAACEAQSLTRAGVAAARSTVGPASVESLIGASNPALPALRQLPASRTSAVAAGDLTTPAGLKPVTGLIVAAGIEDYTPAR